MLSVLGELGEDATVGVRQGVVLKQSLAAADDRDLAVKKGPFGKRRLIGQF